MIDQIMSVDGLKLVVLVLSSRQIKMTYKLYLKNWRLQLNVQELLNLRTRFEDVTTDFKFESNEHPGSCINTLKWFVESGHKSNSLRNGYQEALEIAEAIVTEYEHGRGRNQEGWPPSS